jgi:hypothetical protein
MDIYRERLTPGVGLHIALTLLLPLGFGMIAPLSIVGGIVNAIGIYLAAHAWLYFGAPQVRVTATILHAGRATIERSAVTNPRVVTLDQRPEALANARTWKVLRAWIPTGVMVDITDPADPTPHWYMSSRRPEQLVAALKTKTGKR